MNEYEQLMTLANAGADFKEFAGSNVGRYMLDKARQDEVAALRKLATVDPADREAIHKLQLEAIVPRRVIKWIDEVISAGKTAEWQLQNLE
jgi:hypothetical protein